MYWSNAGWWPVEKPIDNDGNILATGPILKWKFISSKSKGSYKKNKNSIFFKFLEEKNGKENLNKGKKAKTLKKIKNCKLEKWHKRAGINILVVSSVLTPRVSSWAGVGTGRPIEATGYTICPGQLLLRAAGEWPYFFL